MSNQIVFVEQPEPNSAHFDPSLYISYFIERSDKCTQSGNDFITAFLEMLHNVFAEHGGSRGKALLDVGTGPTLWHLISASKQYEKITLAEPLDRNKVALENFRNSRNVDENFAKYLKMVAKLEKQEGKWDEVRARLRSSVKTISKLNIAERYILGAGKSEDGQYDCVVSCLFLEVACTNADNYERAVKKLVSLAKRGGGRVVLAGLMNENYFVHGTGSSMTSCPVLWTMLEAILQRSGCTISKRDTEYFGEPMRGIGCYVIDACRKELFAD